jgi:hypothetical protein
MSQTIHKQSLAQISQTGGSPKELTDRSVFHLNSIQLIKYLTIYLIFISVIVHS